MIFEASGQSTSWTWQLGDPAVERRGTILVLDGQTPTPVLVPGFGHVATTGRADEDRDVLLVFGVDL
jgi:hypothetical protein